MTRPVRKKLIAIVETVHLRRLLDLLAECGVTGFTVVDAREGRGLEGDWHRGDFADATEKKLVHVITNAETAERVFAAAEPFFKRFPGIIYGHDVEVVRGERF
ncbi:hypothetical protein E5163_12015 [Marinicauda algicola]|uniref:Nitrogen regulatory protein P-II n=1 Tax=Marinicauda algicola TaxID=2029849 RepID=A0A4S2GZL4_9PROT|nr:hypothetical protein [Marinicauda algicola]TGY88533.1 hypothetical protein E5163_12015 [Marinicauda algicola]